MRAHFADTPPDGLDLGLPPCVEASFGGPPPEDVEILADGMADPASLAGLIGLRAVIVPWAGVPPKLCAAVHALPGVELYNLHHNAADTAEMAVALLYAAAKRIPPLDAALRRGDWAARLAPAGAIRLEGKRAVVLGYGEIGKRIGRALEAAGMDVRKVARSAREGVLGVEDLGAALEGAGAVVCSVPGTEDSKSILDRERLARLADQGIVVNVGRGSVVDEDALYDEVSSGRLRAGLDVWWRYPRGEAETQPSNHPFGDLWNVVMTPHVGGASDASDLHRWRDLADLVGRIAEGNPPRPVSTDLGY